MSYYEERVTKIQYFAGVFRLIVETERGDVIVLIDRTEALRQLRSLTYAGWYVGIVLKGDKIYLIAREPRTQYEVRMIDSAQRYLRS